MDDEIDDWLKTGDPTTPKFTIISINNINIENIDIGLLKPREWLNDNIINTVLYLITRNSPSTFFFNTYFIQVYRNRGYTQSIRNSSRRIDPEGTGELFSQRIVFIPVNPGEIHWALVAINMVEKTITYYCSKKWRAEVISKSHLEHYFIILFSAQSFNLSSQLPGG